MSAFVSTQFVYNLGSIPPNELAADSIDTWHRSAILTKPRKQAGASLVELGVPIVELGGANRRIEGDTNTAIQ